jgi:hypothetical protein
MSAGPSGRALAPVTRLIAHSAGPCSRTLAQCRTSLPSESTQVEAVEAVERHEVAKHLHARDGRLEDEEARDDEQDVLAGQRQRQARRGADERDDGDVEREGRGRAQEDGQKTRAPLASTRSASGS